MAKQTAIGEWEPRPRDVLRVERNLNAIGYFTPRRNRPKENSKEVTLFRTEAGVRLQATARILAQEDYGLPITADQDKFYAFTKILETARKRIGRIDNPVAFSSSEILKLLGRKHGGSSYEEIDQWLDRMVSTTIVSKGALYLAGRKKFAKDTFHVFDRVIRVGEELPDGSVAGQVYVVMSGWLLANFDDNYVLPIDYELYRELKRPISKALVPQLQIWFYANRNNTRGTIEKRYAHLSELLSIRGSKHLSKIRETLDPSLAELKTHRLIHQWTYEETADGTDYKLVLSPGERFMTERQARFCGSSLPQGSEKELFQTLLGELKARGLNEDVARRLLFDVPDLAVVKLQIEHGDFLKTRRKIDNPPGFYYFLIRSNPPIPDHLLERGARRTRTQIQNVERDYSTFREREAEQALKGRHTAEEIAELVHGIKTKLLEENPEWSYFTEHQFSDCCRSRLLDDMAAKLELPTFEEFARQQQMTLVLS
jgi:hypothetical protein